MDKARSRAPASRGKKGGSCSSNPPPSEPKHKKGKSKVKKNKKNTKEAKKEEKKGLTPSPMPIHEMLGAQPEPYVDGYLNSDDSWDGPFFVTDDGRRHAIAFGLILTSDEEEYNNTSTYS